MKTKAKKFSKKLLALFMAIVMGVTCFSGAIVSYGAVTSSGTKYNDAAVDYNNIGWPMLSDEQVATAALDYLDNELLPKLGALENSLGAMLGNTTVSVLHFKWDGNNHQLSVYAKVVFDIKLMTITLKLGSVDGLMETIESINSQLGGTLADIAGSVVDLGDILSLSLSATNGMRRSNTSSVDIIRGIVGLIYENQQLINKFLQGTFTLGKTINLDVYGKIGEIEAISMDVENWQSNLVYNLVRQLIFKHTTWYTEDEIIAFKGGRPAGTLDKDGKELPAIEAKTFVFDDELLKKMTTELLDKISVLVTYNQEYNVLDPDTLKPTQDENGKYVVKQDTSATRYAKIKAYMTANSCDYAKAAGDLGYDPNIVYSDEFVDSDGNYQNVLLFAYGSPDKNGLATETTEKIILDTGDNLFSFGQQALRFAWKTVLKGTLGLLHVNNGYDFGHGANFDNNYYYYIDQAYGWNKKALASNYTEEKVQAWANHLVHSTQKGADGTTTDVKVPLYESYGAANAAEFLGWVKEQLTNYDRTLKEGSTGKWGDIDATTLVAKLRYSPLVDYYFSPEAVKAGEPALRTGPINLYFMQTGSSSLDAFFDNYYKDGKFTYSSMVAALNDLLVAAVDDIFVNRPNVNNVAKRPTLAKVGSDFTSITSTETGKITTTLVNNALEVVQYTADAIDANILKAFYDANGEKAKLSEANIETAMVPLLIACIGEINLDGAGKLCDMIHPKEWDSVKDAEGIAYLALKEYLSYVLPNYDYSPLITYDDQEKIVASLENTILPMARDAVAFVMQTYVPVSDGKGNAFSVENKKPGDAGYYVNGYASGTYNKTDANGQGANDLFTLLNSVVCYYADKYTSSKITTVDGGRTFGVANGIACLLGFCDKNGNSLINANNDLFTNINIIVNKAFPVIGTLQGKGYGAADSYDLIWNKIVKGILDIGPNSGVTNFINQVLTIVSADPIQKTPIVQTVYDLAEDLLNALFGPRYNGQDWVPVPERSKMPADQQATPFNYAIQAPQVAGTYTTNDKGEITSTAPGLIGKALYNMIEFTGQGYNGVATYPDTMFPGIAFAVVAVNSFTDIFPVYGDHILKTAKSSFEGGLTKNGVSGNISDTLIIKNASTGINTITLNGLKVDTAAGDGRYEQTQNSRYYVKVKSVAGTGVTVGAIPTGLIAPDSKSGIPVTFTVSADENLYKVTTTYAITDADGNVLYDNLTTSAYKYISKAYNWIDVVYPSYHGIDATRLKDGIHRFPEILEPDNNSSKTEKGFTTTRTDTIGNRKAGLGPYISVTYPKIMVLEKSDLGAINDLGFRVNNTNRFGESILRGIYFYDDATVKNSMNNDANVTVGYLNAKPLFDKTTGGILNVDKVDYMDADGKWQRNGVTGYNLSEVPADAIATRTHIAYTLDEANKNGFLAAAVKDADTGLYTAVYLKEGSGNYTYEKNLENMTMAGPMDGIYIQSHAVTVGSNSSTYTNPFKYDGTTDIQPGMYERKIMFYNKGNTQTTGKQAMTFYIADDSSKATLKESIDSLTDVLDRYDATDLKDESLYTSIQTELNKALQVYGTAINDKTYAGMGDTRHLVATTQTTGSELGDRAYLPYTPDNVHGNAETGVLAMPDDVYADAVTDGSFYYLDEDMTLPIYTNVPLKANDVVDGCDPFGNLVEVDKDGKVYLVNDEAYEYEWKTTDNTGLKWPIYAKSDNLLVVDGKQQYTQTQFVYRDKYGNKVNSNQAWVCKFADTSYQLYEYSYGDEYRGYFTGTSDELKYYQYLLQDNLDTTQANVLFENITLARTGLNETNFVGITFSAMTKAAKNAEKNFSVIIPSYVDKETGITVPERKVSPTDAVSIIKDLESKGYTVNWYTESTLSMVQIQNYLNLFNHYLPKAVERGYLGDKVQAEIQCTTGTTYDNLTVVSDAVWVDQVDENGNTVKVIDKPAVVKYNNASGVTVPYGAVDENNNLVNNGATKYTEASWNTFVTEIAEAVTMAQTGNSTSYAGKDRNYYNTGVDYTACVSECYTEFKQLKVAEIALIEDIPVGGYNVTASLVVAKDATGATDGVAVNGDYTITLTDADKKVVATKTFTSAKDANTFTLEGVPNGTYTMTITSAYSIARTATVVVNGADVTAAAPIAIVACDYDQNLAVDSLDAVTVYQQAAEGGALYADLDGNNAVDSLDAVIVYVIASGTLSLPEITIQNF